jgi:hypothetical protein
LFWRLSGATGCRHGRQPDQLGAPVNPSARFGVRTKLSGRAGPLPTSPTAASRSRSAQFRKLENVIVQNVPAWAHVIETDLQEGDAEIDAVVSATVPEAQKAEPGAR